MDFSKIEDTDERIKEMILKIYTMIKEIRPMIVVTEMTVVNRNAQAQRNLTLILGAIQGKCLEKNIAYYSFRPTEWRKKISEEKKPRKRAELKEWSKNKVSELFDIEDINDDISDAILLGQAYINLFE